MTVEPSKSKCPETSESTISKVNDPERRKFFKRAVVGGGTVLAAGMSATAVGRKALDGKPDPDPFEIDESIFKPKDQRDVLLTQAASRVLYKRNPERSAIYSKANGREFNLQAGWVHYALSPHEKEHRYNNDKPGFTQLDLALAEGGWEPLKLTPEGQGMPAGVPNTQFFTWDQSKVHPNKYQFKSKLEAANAIKTAAKAFGAVRCGITTRDKRFDYDPIYNVLEEKTLTWEEDFPFEPKTVIVAAVPEDFDGVMTAPTYTSEGVIANGYARMAVLGSSLARFIKGLGYHSVAAGNDLGISTAYGIKAGLGEGGRNQQLIVPGYGPRVRLIKVYTDFEFVEYDEPRSWGITNFCKSCKKCAEACPSGALPMGDDTSFTPQHQHKDVQGYDWAPQVGVKKFYIDAQKCFEYWVESDTDCGACMAACTFNEPDYWHHWFIMSINPFAPDILHSTMAELHPAFGYGKTQDPEQVKKFWTTGQGMRVNISNRNSFGASGNS